ncbi:tellurite resistance protein TehB [Yersinia frederiksenii]|uniref:Tellurite resistance protein TehB n=1 Tax=Yersinia frederiksenii TaxID=29484 RepID=A0AAI9ER29_YERFR|nr:tellurite resistance protein TehB [Yersinia frederiksenii]
MKLTIPANYVHTRATQFFDISNLPAALLSHHNTKAGVYGRLSVMQGAVKYFGFSDAESTTADLELVIEAGHFGISPPEKWHQIGVAAVPQ